MRLAILVLLASCVTDAQPSVKPWSADPRCLEVCKTGGWCQFYEGQCMALSDQDCKASEMCSKFFDCEARDGRCYPTACKVCPDAVP